MKQSTEAEITRYITDKLTKVYYHGLWWYKVSDRYTSGIPDIIGCYNGQFFAIEVKRSKGKARKLQDFVIDRINKCGGYVAVINSREQFDEFFSELLRRK